MFKYHLRRLCLLQDVVMEGSRLEAAVVERDARLRSDNKAKFKP